MRRRVLIVRLGALGDLVHTLPVLAALRRAWPDAVIDWVVDARYAAFLSYVRGYTQTIVVGGGATGLLDAVGQLRRRRYDVALDLQGLIKSAALARLSGATRVLGFAPGHLREPAARVFHHEHVTPPEASHVVWKNLSLVTALGVSTDAVTFSFGAPLSAACADLLPGRGTSWRYAVVNPGAGWPNKRWSPERFGAIAAHLREAHGLLSVVTWGPQERALAERVVAASDGAAVCAPPTSLGDLIALLERAALFVGGDTGPLQLAVAAGVPCVSVFGPTNPVRNGSWIPGDLAVSRFETCDCHHKRQCRRATPCIDDITLDEVRAAVDARLAAIRPA